MSVHATLLIDGRANATERISDPQQRREHVYLLKIAGLVFSIAAIGGSRNLFEPVHPLGDSMLCCRCIGSYLVLSNTVDANAM